MKDSAVFECKYSGVCLGHFRAPASVVSDTHADSEIGFQADPRKQEFRRVLREGSLQIEGTGGQR
jgi:hypothetical protein